MNIFDDARRFISEDELAQQLKRSVDGTHVAMRVTSGAVRAAMEEASGDEAEARAVAMGAALVFGALRNPDIAEYLIEAGDLTKLAVIGAHEALKMEQAWELFAVVGESGEVDDSFLAGAMHAASTPGGSLLSFLETRVDEIVVEAAEAARDEPA